MVARLAALTLVLVACSSDPTVVDAPAAVHDAPHAVVDSPSADAAAPACTGALYDGCLGPAAGCMSGNCKLFNGSSFMVCTQACSAANPCPTQNGAAVPCNNMGICKPAAPNACTPH